MPGRPSGGAGGVGTARLSAVGVRRRRRRRRRRRSAAGARRLGRPVLRAGQPRSVLAGAALRLRRLRAPLRLRQRHRRRLAVLRRRRRTGPTGRHLQTVVRLRRAAAAVAGRRPAAASGSGQQSGRVPGARIADPAAPRALSISAAQRQQLQVHQPFSVGLSFLFSFLSRTR